MTLQASGAITLAQIQAEFGGANPISLSEYYGAAGGIPASGSISMSHFYSKSAYHTTSRATGQYQPTSWTTSWTSSWTTSWQTSYGCQGNKTTSYPTSAGVSRTTTIDTWYSWTTSWSTFWQ